MLPIAPASSSAGDVARGCVAFGSTLSGNETEPLPTVIRGRPSGGLVSHLIVASLSSALIDCPPVFAGTPYGDGSCFGTDRGSVSAGEEPRPAAARLDGRSVIWTAICEG